MYLWRRIVGLLLRPRAEWDVIAGERDEVAALCQSYVSVLTLIPAASLLVGVWLAGGRYLGAAAISTALTGSMVNWILSIGASIASATIIEKLSPLFDADADMTAAFKLVAYSSTPFWLFGICYALEPLTRLVALGAAWSAYLYFVGAPAVAKVPEGRVPAFVGASLVVVLAANVALRALFSAFKVPYMGY